MNQVQKLINNTQSFLGTKDVEAKVVNGLFFSVSLASEEQAKKVFNCWKKLDCLVEIEKESRLDRFQRKMVITGRYEVIASVNEKP